MRPRAMLTPSIRLLSRSPGAPFTTVSRTSRPIISRTERQLVQRKLPIRSYADSAPAATPPKPATPPPPKKKGTFRAILRWSWRLTYISAIAGLGYVGYGIYLMRNPVDQEEPHPSKKTLVVLGKKFCGDSQISQTNCDIRDWLGCSIASQKA
jgi:hypothetical protein